jgi:hypothetical protein
MEPLLEKKKAQRARQREIVAWPTKLTMICDLGG